MARWTRAALALLLVGALCHCQSDDAADVSAPLPRANTVTPPPPALIDARPRLLLPELQGKSPAQFEALFAKQYPRDESDATSRFRGCNDEALFSQMSCYVQTGSPEARQQMRGVAERFKLIKAEDAAVTTNGWRLALLFDLLMIEGLPAGEQQMIEAKLREALQQTLSVLNADSATLFHHRATLAAHAFVIAASLGQHNEQDKSLFMEAWQHFADLSQAVKLTEAWPEGYNYWIQNRAFAFVLAASVYQNAVTEATRDQALIDGYCQQMRWPFYALRPDGQIEPQSDEGSRVDLNEETRPVIDMAVRLCDDPALARLSRYLAINKRTHGYYYDYKWIVPFARTPKQPLPEKAEPDLRWLWQGEPNAKLFGAGVMNQLYYHDLSAEEPVFLSARAGDSLSHHGNYDAGHFSLFYHAPLFVNASRYGSIFSDNRLYFSLRTVAKNSLLVLRPDERVKPNHLFKHVVADGGQRITQPTGAAVTSVSHWQSLRTTGPHLAGGEVKAYAYQPAQFLLLQADLTKAYNSTWYDENNEGGKVSRVQRWLVYWPQEKRLLIADDIHKTNADYVAKSLFHTVHKPVFSEGIVRAGTQQDGIIVTEHSTFGISNGRGRALLNVLAPGAVKAHIVGGEFYRFYVEADGDDSDLDGMLVNRPSQDQPWLDNPAWRIEIQEALPKMHNLHLLDIALASDQFPASKATLVANDEQQWIVDGTQCRWHHFLIAPKAETPLPLGQQACVLYTGLPAGKTFTIAGQQNLNSDQQGVLFWSAQAAGNNTDRVH
ncbi:hypothetical protein [Permianibacter aggregans]|uniref:Heparinase II/III-like protein n=1 Tax=Permianibacter aggregans TaxID=1510150 RepID=A0A4R6UZH4_9GAMM|nr:hypothetical protein [Permianibacter aggregans]QGX40074.1 hypothetical protein E2H98_10500 [Permianibacter aggregans]TDQ49114.1 hypothetical protein EV696_10588 [Permianibacter aggregans]